VRKCTGRGWCCGPLRAHATQPPVQGTAGCSPGLHQGGQWVHAPWSFCRLPGQCRYSGHSYGCSTGVGLLPACPAAASIPAQVGLTAPHAQARLLVCPPDRTAATSGLRPCTCARDVPSWPSKETGTRIHGSAGAGAAGVAAAADMAEGVLQLRPSYRDHPTLRNLCMADRLRWLGSRLPR
jgi:hypothetical protein